MKKINYNVNDVNLAAKYVAADGAALFFHDVIFKNPFEMERIKLHYSGIKGNEKKQLDEKFDKELETFLGNVINSWGKYRAEIYTIGKGVLVDAGIFRLKIIYKKGHFSMFYYEPDGIKISSEPNKSEKTGKRDKEKVNKKSNDNSFKWESA